LQFNSKAYGGCVADILALDQNGNRLMPLVSGVCSSEAARLRLKSQKPAGLFPDAIAPGAALGGLWLYFSCFDEGHEIVQDLSSVEGSYWHAILHRQEPDAGNSTYWFRSVGKHPTFAELNREASDILSRYPDAGFRTGGNWDPFSFVEFCERARQQPNSSSERAALEIQRIEWQLLFDHCARPAA